MTALAAPEPPRLTTPHRRLITVLTVVAVLAIVHFGRDLLMPFALAVLVSFALQRPVSRLERWGLGRAWSVGIVMSAVLCLLTAIGWLVVSQMKGVIDELPDHRLAITDKLSAVTRHLVRMQQAGEALVTEREPAVTGTTAAPPLPVPRGTSPEQPLFATIVDADPLLLRQLPAALVSLLNPLGTAGMVMLFAIFMLFHREDLRNRLLRLVSNGDLTATTHALNDALQRISRYLGRQVLVNGSFGLAVGAGLLLIGVPGWALWGLLCAMLRFLPYIGMLLGASMPLAMALATSHGWDLFLATAGLFVGIELLVNLAVEPWLYGASAGVSPFAVLVAAAVWTWLWGPVGLLLAMPLTVVIVVLGKTIPGLGFLNVLFGTDEALPIVDRFYQRLLANDPDESMRILEKVAATMPFVEVCETVLVPALSLAEHDRTAGKIVEAEYTSACDTIRDAADDLEHRLPPLVAGALAPGAVRGVVCLPVKGGAVEVAGDLAALLLARAGHAVRPLSSDLTFVERVERIEANETVVLVTLPNAALRLANAVCKRLQSRRPELRIVVMAWGAIVEPTAWRHRSLVESTDGIATNIGDVTLALARIQQSFATPPSPATAPAVG